MADSGFAWGDTSTWSLGDITASVEQAVGNVAQTVQAGKTILSNPTPQGTQQPSNKSSSTFPSLTSGWGLYAVIAAIVVGAILLFKRKRR